MSSSTFFNTYRINKKSSSNLFKDNIYKYCLYGIAAFISLFILISVIFVFVSGIDTTIKADIGIGQLIFGDSYTPLAANTLAAGFIVINTVWMALICILVATPIAIGTSIIITRVLSKTLSTIMYAIVAILAAIPSVIYGMFGYSVINNILMKIGIETGSLLSIILTNSFMIVPTITIMTIASIKLTDRKLEESSYALGSTKTQTSFYITLKTAKAGILTGIIFAVGRCLGETTAISMIAPQASFYDGVVLSPFNASLFLGPSILGLMPGGESTFDIYLFPIISAFLLATSMLIFGSLKFVEFKTNDSQISKKQSNKISIIKNIEAKRDKYGISFLTAKEQKLLYNSEKAFLKNMKDYSYSMEDIALLELQKSSVGSDIKIKKYKKNKSIQHNLFICVSALIGVVLLLSIFIFLFNGGFNLLNWNMLTSRDFYGDPINQMYGLASPMLGTLITIIIALIISVPIGASLGIFLTIYINKDSKFGYLISLALQILTAIPTIVWSTIAALVFMGTSFDENAKGLEPAIFIGIILLPTMIKTTEDAAKRVNSGLVEGAASLGATNLKTSGSVVFKEALPSIFAASLLGVSTVLAESTIFVSLLDTNTNSHNDINSWISDGGYSLSATIWKLNAIAKSNFDNIEKYSMLMNEIKTIGLILMLIIFVMSISSVMYSNRKYISGTGFLLSVPLFIIGTYVYSCSQATSIILEVFAIVSVCVGITFATKLGERKNG